MSLSAASTGSSGAASGAQDRNVGLVTIYSNGFIIGNSEFRDIKDPKNLQLLNDLKQGEVPDELDEICRKEWSSNVGIQLINKSTETFTLPKPKFDFAKSQGQSLGRADATASAAASAQSFADAAPRRLEVDASQPTTTLQLVMGGKSLSGLSSFELVAGFPPKPLTNPALMLKEAGLFNGSVSQRGG